MPEMSVLRSQRAFLWYILPASDADLSILSGAVRNPKKAVFGPAHGVYLRIHGDLWIVDRFSLSRTPDY